MDSAKPKPKPPVIHSSLLTIFTPCVLWHGIQLPILNIVRGIESALAASCLACFWFGTVHLACEFPDFCTTTRSLCWPFTTPAFALKHLTFIFMRSMIRLRVIQQSLQLSAVAQLLASNVPEPTLLSAGHSRGRILTLTTQFDSIGSTECWSLKESWHWSRHANGLDVRRVETQYVESMLGCIPHVWLYANLAKKCL